MAVKKTKPLRGKALLRAAINQIIQNPKTWNQRSYHCGTKHCVAGWCQILGGRTKKEIEATEQAHNGIDCAEDAASLLGMNGTDLYYQLFESDLSLADIYQNACEILGQKPKFQPL